MRRRSLSVLALTFPLCGIAAAERQVLKVVLFDVAPYVLVGPAGRLSGPYVRIAEEIGKSAGFDVQIILRPFARIPGSLADGQADLTLSFATEALSRVSQTIGDIMQVDSLVVSSRQKPLDRIEQLAGRVVGRARGGCQDLARHPLPGLELVEVNNFDNGLRMLAMGRLDGLCLTRDVLEHYSRVAGLNRAEFGSELVIGHRMVSAFVRKGIDPVVLEKLRNAVANRKLGTNAEKAVR